MQVKVFLTALFVSFFSLVSFAQPSATEPTSTQPASTPSAAQPSSDTAQSNDGQTLQTLSVINGFEIAAAKLALKNSTNPNVKKFAQVMLRDHSKNLAMSKVLAHKLKITPAASDKSNELQKGGSDELDKLKTLSGKDFDQEYISTMIKGHGDVLNLLDNTVIPNTTNAKLLPFIKATRETVSRHLQMAQDTQKTL